MSRSCCINRSDSLWPVFTADFINDYIKKNENKKKTEINNSYCDSRAIKASPWARSISALVNREPIISHNAHLNESRLAASSDTRIVERVEVQSGLDHSRVLQQSQSRGRERSRDGNRRDCVVELRRCQDVLPLRQGRDVVDVDRRYAERRHRYFVRNEVAHTIRSTT